MKWLNNTLYTCKPIGKYPALYIERCMHGKYKGIKLSFFEYPNGKGCVISLTKRYARLLKKRIELALEN